MIFIDHKQHKKTICYISFSMDLKNSFDSYFPLLLGGISRRIVEFQLDASFPREPVVQEGSVQ